MFNACTLFERQEPTLIFAFESITEVRINSGVAILLLEFDREFFELPN